MPRRIAGLQGSGRRGGGLGLGGGRGRGRGLRGNGGGLGVGKVLIDIDAEDLSPANASAEYAEDKMEAAIMLQGFNDMKGADSDKVIGKSKDGRELTARDQIADMIADRINNTPFYQDNFGIGGDSGRTVVGFQEVEDYDKLPDDVKKALPRDAIIPMIANDKTNSIGPMTARASADPDDMVEFITMSQLADMAKQ